MMKEVKEVFRMNKTHGAAGLVILLCALSSTQALAAPAAGKPGVVDVAGSSFEIPDVEVLNQDGRKVRFYSDLIKDRVVVVSFFFTSCTMVCPMQGRALAKLQTELAERMGKDVFFVLVSKDPKNDTPERVRQWAAEVGAGRGWTLVTGPDDGMTKLLASFTGEGPGPQMHEPILLIGNDRTGVWTEARSLSESEDLVKVIDQVSGPVAAAER